MQHLFEQSTGGSRIRARNSTASFQFLHWTLLSIREPFLWLVIIAVIVKHHQEEYFSSIEHLS